MVDTPTIEEQNDFQVAKAFEHSNRELNEEDVTEREELEGDMDLKALLLDPQAKTLFPLLNKPDLLISFIPKGDKKTITLIRYWIDLATDLYINEFTEPAKLLATRILSNMNFNRSLDGFQQQSLITRVKAQRLDLTREDGGVSNFTKKMRR